MLKWTITLACLIPYTHASGNAPRGVAELPIWNVDGSYMIDLYVGTPGQKQQCLLSTYDSDSWVIYSNNPYCTTSSGSQISSNDQIACGSTYEPGNSTTFVNASSGFPYFTRSSVRTFADVLFVQDNVALVNDQLVDGTVAEIQRFGLSNATIGLAMRTNYSNCVIGLGPVNGESSATTIENGQVKPTYDNIPVLMKANGFTERVAYSVFLDTFSAASGTLLFGGVDHAKYSGNMSLVPIVKPVTAAGVVGGGPNQALNLQVVVMGVSAVSDKNYTVQVSNSNFPVVLAAGSSYSYLPTPIVDGIASAFGMSWIDSWYQMPCNRTGSINFNISGVVLSASLQQMQVLLSHKQGIDVCGLVLKGQDQPIWVLGDGFIRNTYMAVDLESMVIGLAPAVYTNDTDIEAISTGIPSATPAPLYNQTIYSTNVTGNEFTPLYSQADLNGAIKRGSTLVPLILLLLLFVAEIC